MEYLSRFLSFAALMLRFGHWQGLSAHPLHIGSQRPVHPPELKHIRYRSKY